MQAHLKTSVFISAIILSIGAVVPLAAQNNPGENVKAFGQGMPGGFPIDWSSRNVIYPPGSAGDLQMLLKDPRFLRQVYLRQRDRAAMASAGLHAEMKSPPPPPPPPKGGPIKVDWALSLANGALAQNMFPAKYSFATNGTPSCSDWVVFGLNVTGNTTAGSGQANLIAVNNLYGTSNGCSANPNVIFALATTGPITTSPTISYNDNGAQVAFVDNEGGKATLRVLKYSTAAGNGTAAGAPVAYPGAGTEVHLSYSTTTNSNSSLYVDYASDTAYVGDDGGTLYKISPVFGGGTPAVLASATLDANKKLTGPVFDQLHSAVVVGASDGKLYAVASSNLAALSGSGLTVGTGTANGIIVDPPVLVTGSTTTYAFVTTGCTSGSVSALFEASITSSALAQVASRNIGSAHNSCATNNLHAPAPDDAIYDGSTGFLYACGTIQASTGQGGVGEPPELYSYSFNPTNGTLGSSAAHTLTPSGTDAGEECSPVTLFTSNGVSTIFMGMGDTTTSNVNSAVVTNNSGVIAALDSATTPNALGGTSGIIVDNSSGTPTKANIYFSGLTSGNIGSGSCQSFSVTGTSSSNTVTLTGTGFNFTAGSTIVVTGTTNFNGTFVLTSATSTSLTYTDSSAGTHGTGQSGTASWGTCAFQLTQSSI